MLPTEWIRRAREGDADAFGVVMARYERMVLRTSLRLLGRMDRAQDAAQETFRKLYKNLGRSDETRDLGPWLYRIAVNVCRDVERRSAPARLVPIHEVSEADLSASRAAPDSAEEEASREERSRIPQDAISTLPAKERAAIVLRDLEGLSTSEVARVLGSSQGTVGSQVSTARVKVKAYLEERQVRP